MDWAIAITAAHRRIRDRLARGSVATTLLLADVFATNLLGQADLLRSGQLVLPGPDARIAYVDPVDVGHVAASLLTSATPPLGRVVVTGPALLGNAEVADIAGRAFRGAPAEYVPVDPQPFTDSLVQAGWPAFAAGAVAEMHTTIAVDGPIPVSDTVRTHLGRDATSLSGFLGRVLG